MSFARVQIAIAYASCLMVIVVVNTTAKPDDRVVYVVFPPWRPSGDVRHLIATSGARPIVGSWLPATKVATADRGTLARLYALGAMLVVSADPFSMCTNGGAAAR